jgi:DNA-binding response OmpR family regulator
MIVLLTKDLLAGSQVAPAVRATGRKLASVPSLEAYARRISETPPRLVIIDLNMPGLDLDEIVTQARAASEKVEVVAFGPHVHVDRLKAARSAGCDLVLTRGQFVATLPEILETLGDGESETG